MKASVIIPTRNRAATLGKTLASLDGVTIPDDLSVEVIVVDNGSTDETPEVVSSFTSSRLNCRSIKEPRTGVSNARNAGISAASGDILLFVDDDVRLSENWLAEMTAPIREGNGDVVQGQIVPAPHLQRSWMENNPDRVARLAQITEFDPDSPTLTTASAAFDRRVFDVVPGFDPELGPGRLGFEEDRLLGKQLSDAGMRFTFAKEAVAVHHCETSRLDRSTHLRDAKKLGRSTAYLQYHWGHKYSGVRGMKVYLLVWLAVSWAKLWSKRIVHWDQWHIDEGIPRWELRGLMDVHMYLHLLDESGRPRAYASPRARHRAQPATDTHPTGDTSIPDMTDESDAVVR